MAAGQPTHLTWHRGFTVDGNDLWPRLLAGYIEELRDDPEPMWDPHLVEMLGMIPNYYLQYYYQTGKMVAKQDAWPPSRAEQVMEIERDFLRMYADPALNEPPEELMQRGGLVAW